MSVNDENRVSSDPVLVARDLSIERSQRIVVQGFHLVAPRGLVLLAGPNGGGKTSVLRVLATLDRPASGSAAACGVSYSGATNLRKVRRCVGYLPQQASFPGHFTGREAVEYAAWLSALPRSQRSAAVTTAMDAFDAFPLADRKIGALSVGERQRIFLAQATVHKPTVLLLDEPTAAVDSEHRAALRQHLRAWTEHGLVVMATHLVEEVELMGDRVLVLADGSVAFDGSARDLASWGAQQPVRGDERAIETALRMLRFGS